MVVLAFLTDPQVVGRILRHLGLAAAAPPLVRSRSSGRVLGFALAEEGGASTRDWDEEGDGSGTPAPPIRPPP
jgi:hypothetical protein